MCITLQISAAFLLLFKTGTYEFIAHYKNVVKTPRTVSSKSIQNSAARIVFYLIPVGILV